MLSFDPTNVADSAETLAATLAEKITGGILNFNVSEAKRVGAFAPMLDSLSPDAANPIRDKLAEQAAVNRAAAAKTLAAETKAERDQLAGFVATVAEAEDIAANGPVGLISQMTLGDNASQGFQLQLANAGLAEVLRVAKVAVARGDIPLSAALIRVISAWPHAERTRLEGHGVTVAKLAAVVEPTYNRIKLAVDRVRNANVRVNSALRQFAQGRDGLTADEKLSAGLAERGTARLAERVKADRESAGARQAHIDSVRALREAGE